MLILEEHFRWHLEAFASELLRYALFNFFYYCESFYLKLYCGHIFERAFNLHNAVLKLQFKM